MALASRDEHAVAVENARRPLRLEAVAEQRHEPLGRNAQAEEVGNPAVLQDRNHDGEDGRAGHGPLNTSEITGRLLAITSASGTRTERGRGVPQGIRVLASCWPER